MAVTIARPVLDAILARAAACRDEVCGLLTGQGGSIAGRIDTANVAAHPADSFEIDPAAHIAALRAARAGGPAVIGHYHSHPNGCAEPSPRDAAAATAGPDLWLIVAGGSATLWRYGADGFVALSMRVVAGDGCGMCPQPPQERP